VRAWRICRRQFADLSGEGARLYGGRWNSPGTPMLYLSEHPALALIEILVHLDLGIGNVPTDYVLLTVEMPNNIRATAVPNSVSKGSEHLFGDRWCADQSSPVLWVPSVLVPQSYNILVNPLHSEASLARIVSVEPLNFDQRLYLNR
jgi:RES domain-containing protein